MYSASAFSRFSGMAMMYWGFRSSILGLSGIVDVSMVSRKQGDYERRIKLKAADTNAAIEGTSSAHLEAMITVCDDHSTINNIDPAATT